MRTLLSGAFLLIATGLAACTGIKAQTPEGRTISVTDPRYNGSDSKVCTYGPPYNNTTHNDGGTLSPARIGPMQTALYYASRNNIPTVTVPAGRTGNLIHTQSNTGGTSCFGLDIPNGVTLQGLGGDTILANLSNPHECPNQQVGQLAQTAVFNIEYYTDVVKYNGPFVCNSSKQCGFDGSSGFTIDPTMPNSHTISFANSNPGAERNFAIKPHERADDGGVLCQVGSCAG